ncbi:MAG: hypothetical protein CMJ76_17360 [Planctomycetaceae bacterium]|nr:hypothetical protein [Planctomycetaceae bacterium]|tara:strand:+ start:109 stop:3006 length:2898 start_codon:yes stop_codon:yes gene_type:complete
MLKRLLGTIGCFAIILIAYSVYALAAAPRIEPPYVSSHASQEGSQFYWETAPSQNRQKLSKLFKDDSWQLESPKIIEWPQGILLFQQYEQAENELIIKPCTCVIFQSGYKDHRLITMHAPQGAVISQDALSSNKQDADFSGRLIGDIVIHSAETVPGANDAIQFITRNVQFEKNRIWTTHDVEFDYAGHYGKGRDLIITLAEQEKSRTKVDSPNLLSRLDSVELIHVDQLVLQTEKQILPNRMIAEATDVPTVKTNKSSEMVIECDGTFRIDVANYRMSIEDKVRVSFRENNQVDDTMTCDKLNVTFTPPYSSEPNSENPLLDTSTYFNPQSIIADGNPVLIQSKSKDLMIKGQGIAIDLEKLKFSIQDAVESTIQFKDFHIKVPKLEYTFADDPARLGTYQAEGAGELRMKPNANNPSNKAFFVQWKGQSALTVNKKNEKVLELDKQARIQLSETESIASDRLHIWLEEIESTTEDNPGKNHYEISPYRLAATGHVEIELPELQAKSQQAHMWITRDEKSKEQTSSNPVNLPKPIDLLDRSNKQQDPSLIKRYIVQGEILQLDLRQMADGIQVNGALMEGDLSFHQEPLPGQSRSSLVLHGERIRLSRSLNGLAELKIDGKKRQGQPAWISYEGFQLSGNTIRLNQQMNLIYIEGEGELVHLAPDDPNPENAKRITWGEQMAFTGSKIQLFGNVKSRFRLQTNTEDAELEEVDLSCKVLELHLNQRLSFQNPQFDSPLHIKEFKAAQEVELNRKTIDNNKQHKHLQNISVENISYYPKENRVIAFGQGSIRHTAIHDGSLPVVGTETADESGIQSFSVEFNEGLSGGLKKVNLTFQGKVKALMSTVPRWDTALNSETIRATKGVELNCDTLTIADISQTGQSSFVLAATGNTYIYQADYTALAHRVSFSQLKNNILMEGGRGEARLWLNTNKTPTPNVAARQIIYDLKNGKIDVHSPSFLDSGR